MKKYIVPVSVILSLFIMVVIASPHTRAMTQMNGQINTVYSPVQKPSLLVTEGNSLVYTFLSSFDPIANVPSGVFVAHISTAKGIIDVQRFIDPSTSVACYYSEFGSTIIGVNCVSTK